METLLKHKGFIEMVARDIIRPDESQQVVKEVLEAYNSLSDTKIKLAVVGCSTCENKYMISFNTILKYINKQEDNVIEKPIKKK
jgi:hypothetical protein